MASLIRGISKTKKPKLIRRGQTHGDQRQGWYEGELEASGQKYKLLATKSRRTREVAYDMIVVTIAADV